MSATELHEQAQQVEGEPVPDEEAEAEETEQPQPEPEPEPEPEPQGVTSADVEALERENGRHERAVAKIMGDDYRYVAACPACDGFGFMWPQPPAPAPRYREHASTQQCETCAGLGDVLTGSKRQGNELIRCGDCKGYGYLPNPATAPAAFADAPAAPAPATAAPAPAPGFEPAPVSPVSEDPRVAELRALGFIVMPPVAQPASS